MPRGYAEIRRQVGKIAAAAVFTIWMKPEPIGGGSLAGETVSIVDPKTVWLTDKLFAANNRITSLEVSFDGKPPVKVKPPATRTAAEVPVGETVSTIAVKIAAVDKGKMNDSCISSVGLWAGDVELAPVFDAAAASALPGAVNALTAALESPDRTGLAALVTFPLTYADANAFFEGGGKPVKIASAKALAASCKADKNCPGSPAIKDPSVAAAVDVVSPTQVQIVFPGGREVSDTWHLTWNGSAWKLTAIDYR